MDIPGWTGAILSAQSGSMKAALLTTALALGLAGCVAAPRGPASNPGVVTAARAAASEAQMRPSVVQPINSDDWMDEAATPGSWGYEDRGNLKLAVFTTPTRGAAFAIQCLAPSREIALIMAGQSVASPTMQVRTESTSRAIAATLSIGELSNVAAALRSDDPLLDAMALSKGRFAVETEGLPPLILPSWAEVSRVIEDCR